MHSSMLNNKTNAKSQKLGVAQQLTIGRNIWKSLLSGR
jgi:hypothetical protein